MVLLLNSHNERSIWIWVLLSSFDPSLQMWLIYSHACNFWVIDWPSHLGSLVLEEAIQSIIRMNYTSSGELNPQPFFFVAKVVWWVPVDEVLGVIGMILKDPTRVGVIIDIYCNCQVQHNWYHLNQTCSNMFSIMMICYQSPMKCFIGWFNHHHHQQRMSTW